MMQEKTWFERLMVAVKAQPMPPLPKCFDGFRRKDDWAGIELHSQGLDAKGREKQIRQTRGALYEIVPINNDDILSGDHGPILDVLEGLKLLLMRQLEDQYLRGTGEWGERTSWCGRPYWQPGSDDNPKLWTLATLGSHIHLVTDDLGTGDGTALFRCHDRDGFDFRCSVYGNFIYHGCSEKKGNPTMAPEEYLRRYSRQTP